MRPSSRQRAVASLLALQLGRGRLEMISFWLLCWKLLRATTGLRRTTAELTDGNHDDSSSGNDNPVDSSPSPTQPAGPETMEISASPHVPDLERENSLGCCAQNEEYYPEACRVMQPVDDGTEGGNGQTNGDDFIFQEDKEKEVEDSGNEDKGVSNTEEVVGDKPEAEKDETTREIKEEYTGNEGSVLEDEDGWRDETTAEVISDFLTDQILTLNSPSSSPVKDLLPPEGAAEMGSQDAWCHDDTDDFSNDHMSDCIQAELAIVYSDSDAAEDPWATFTQDAHQEEEVQDGGQVEDGLDMGAEEQTMQDINSEHQRRKGADEEDAMRKRRDLFLSSPSESLSSSCADSERKVPGDFSITQDTQSENVSSEHLDFMFARQQWKKMEEQAKGKPIPTPGLRVQESFQGTHSSLYPPTRSPRLKRRENHLRGSRETPLSSILSPSSEDSGLDDLSFRSTLEEPESAVEREIRLTLEREEQHRRETGLLAQGLVPSRPSTLLTGQSPPRPPACRTPTLSISPSPTCSSSLPRSAYHEMTANNVIILEPDSSSSTTRNCLLSTAIGGLPEWSSSVDAKPSANIIVVETSNLIIRSASEFCLSSAPLSVETQESTFSSNPFFKLRSLSSQSLVEQEIRVVRQREEEWRRQREEMWRRKREEEWRRGRESYDTVLVSPGLSDSSHIVAEIPDKSVSSPSSPSRTRKMERSSMSCDHKRFI
ncbi:uncharacterized protein LOC128769993 isoform X2 [Synchiropus splendidus]|uniref:uncharacterized protein LOC128769993 isoform X2 n=1 Tax=Synchiropus splendidus TaxID=270530 RepID=UPI00237DA918|nr:uncharacterized protein LOC128769993 isoform X2 [Synchiropus splendidus]